MNPASPSPDLPPAPLRGGRPQRMRWLVPPVMAAVLVGVVGLVPRLAGAQGRPKLAPLSPAALIAKVEAAKVSALSGTVEFKPDLGLPNLSSLGAMGGGTTGSGGAGTSGASGPGGSSVADSAGPGGSSRSGSGGSASASVTSLVTSLLTAPLTAQVFYDGPDHVRVAVAQGQGETDLIRNGPDVWLWQSKSQQVTHAVLSVDHSGAQAPTVHGSGVQPSARAVEPGGVAVPPTPQEVADRLLSSLDPSTRVFVLDTAYVAGRSAYELVLAPKSPQSLVSDMVIAVDAATGLPLRVQVVGRSSTKPALELGYSSITFARPAASNFAFSPPPGAKVDTVPLHGANSHHHVGTGSHKAQTATSVSVVGAGWDSIGVVKGVDLSNPRLSTLLRTATPVSGAWGSGKLFTTSLADALVLPNGTVLVGAVTPQALESAAAGAR